MSAIVPLLQHEKCDVVTPSGTITRPVFPIAAPPPPPRPNIFNSSMSKRNLDTIMEAIRHLEGDNMMCDSPTSGHHRPLATPMAIPPRPPRVSTHIPSDPESSASDVEDMIQCSSTSSSSYSSQSPPSWTQHHMS